jgi:hypothetical protein
MGAILRFGLRLKSTVRAPIKRIASRKTRGNLPEIVGVILRRHPERSAAIQRRVSPLDRRVAALLAKTASIATSLIPKTSCARPRLLQNRRLGFRRVTRMATVKTAMQAISLVIFLTGIFLLGRAYRSGSFPGFEEPPPFNLGIEAEKLNATLPEMVSEGVRLDEARAGPRNSFTYFYTITDDDKARDLSGNQEKLKALEAQLRDRVCSMMPTFREHGTIVIYALKDNSAGTIAEFKIDSMDC